MSFSEQDFEEFNAEAFELLDIAEKCLLGLDQGAEFRASFDTVFRSFHNLKGAAGMMELSALQAHTHELESILMQFKTAEALPKNHISFFLRGIDAAKSILHGQTVDFNYEVPSETALLKVVKEKEKEDDSLKMELSDSGLDEFICEVDEIIERVSENLGFIEDGTYDKDSLDALYRDVHSLKGSAYLFSFNMLGDIGHAMESSLEKLRNGTHGPSEKLLKGLYKSLEVIERIVQKKKARKSDEDFAPIIPVLSKALSAAADQLPVIKAKEELEERANEEIKPLAVVVPKVTLEKAEASESASSIRVPVSLLDNLMTLMGEMVLVRNQVLQYSNKTEDLEFLSMSKRLNVVTSEIQEEMMKTRMQPIGNVLSKFNRVVRDLSHDLGKSINLHISGADTELDKSLLEAIKDPLTHIIRNSCDHGIENPDVRVAAGKNETGTVSVRSYHEGGQVIIEISDDGKGLDKEKLIAKAIEKNIITPAKAATLNDKQASELIFAPGFSTASAVTNVSGRGVGMDVVRTNIEKIGGVVELSGELGHGTNIKLKIPLTLAIIPALLVKCGDYTYAIPQVKLEELVRVDQEEAGARIEILHGAPVYRLRGKILSLVDLNNVLGIKGQERFSYNQGVFNVVVLNSDGTSFGVIVDEVLDTADIVVKPINRLLKSLQVYSGATVLGDGAIALIFDVPGISKMAQIEGKKNVEEVSDKKVQSEIQDFLLVGLSSSAKHAITLNYVNRLEEFSQKDIEYSGSERVVRYRDHLLPIIDTNHSLGYKRDKEVAEKISVIVIEKAGNFYGLEVDSILDTFSTSLDVRPAVKNHPGIFGNISTADELVVVIDPFEIISNEALLTDEVTTLANEGGELKVLLVEDTVFFRRAIQEVLERKGHQVVIANDGLEALEILEKNSHFDIIVSDIEMPRVNGFELAKAVRAEPRFRALPMIAVSSKADKIHMKQGMEAGFDMYLEKLKPLVLCAAIAELTQKEHKKVA